MNAFFAPLAGSLLNSAIEGLLLTAAVALALRLLPAVSATTRSLIWGMAFLLLICLHFAPQAAAATTHHVAPRWALWLSYGWMTASTWRIAQFLMAAVRLHQLCRSARPLGETVPISKGRSALLCVSSDVYRPTVAGFFRPRVLLPQALLADISQEERRYVLLHEVTHLRRADNWTNLVQKLALIVFPLDPALLWIEHRLCREREFACDERVVAETRAPRSYATCLTTLAERGMFARASSLALGAWQRKSELVERVERMLRPGSSASRARNAAVGSVVSALLVAGAITVARQPQLFTFAAPAAPVFAAAEDVSAPTAGAHMVLTSAHLPLRANDTVTTRKRTSPALKRTLRRSASPRRTPELQSTVFLPRQPRRSQLPTLGVDYRLTRVSADSSTPVFVPVTTYAVATPEGWLVITM